MQNDFDSYIKQLQELEQSDNKATLYSFCSLNEPILSYFKGIWNPLQAILCSSYVDTRIINEIKPILKDLSEIKDSYQSLKVNAKPEIKDEVLRFQEQIDAMTIYTYTSVVSKLHTLQQKNNAVVPKVEKMPVSNEKYWNDNKERILRGDLSTLGDISLAEAHVSEGRSLFFFKSLAAATKQASVLDNIYSLSKIFFEGENLISILWCLVSSSVSFLKKEDAILDLLYRIDKVEDLNRIHRYCNTQRTIETYSRKSKALTSKPSGCLSTIVFFVVFIGLSAYGIIAFFA